MPSIQQGSYESDDQEAGMAVGTIILVIAFFFLCFNVAFIVPDLIYAYEDSICVLHPVEGISFNLKTWLEVDAYIRIGFVAVLFISAIVTCVSISAGGIAVLCSTILLLLYGLFSLAWSIVGAVLFWGKLKPLGVC